MRPLLELTGIRKHFGGIHACQGLTLRVAEGESLGLIGPNGAGKTTVFSLIMGEHRQNAGTIHFNGEEVSRVPTHGRVKRGIARTYQVPRPFGDMDVVSNIRVGMMPDSLWRMLAKGPDHEAEIELALSVGFAEADIHRLPGELSMGDLRKLELARALATHPRIILLDEVFAGLTVGEIAQMSALLARKRAEGMTFVIVSHDLRSLEPLVDRAVAMTFGRLVAAGNFEDVLANEEVRAAYLGH
ncbi:MAG: ATP-binding cassette domain-containing protein [Gammaproteobacteria bacterium]|nr:ATP-binding cassette domain-containing protein [Gammaproteobacteria bacterium]